MQSNQTRTHQGANPSRQGHPTRLREAGTHLCILSLSVAAIAFPLSLASASWTEGGQTIHTLDEIRSYVETSVAASIGDGELDSQTPVLLPPELDINDPNIWPSVLLQSGLKLQTLNGSTEWVVSDPTTSPLRMSARRRDETPTTPTLSDPDATNSGAAYLGGRRIAGPYRIDVEGGKVLLNGVTVFPPPGPRNEPVVPTTKQEQEFELITRLMDGFEVDQTSLGTPSAQARLKASFEQDPGVAEVSWISDDVARLQWNDGRDEILNFEELRLPDDPDPAFLQEHIETQAELLRQALRDNMTLLCGATYLIPVLHLSADSFVQTVDRVASSSEPGALKLLRLQAHVGHREAAADLLSNAD